MSTPVDDVTGCGMRWPSLRVAGLGTRRGVPVQRPRGRLHPVRATIDEFHETARSLPPLRRCGTLTHLRRATRRTGAGTQAAAQFDDDCMVPTSW